MHKEEAWSDTITLACIQRTACASPHPVAWTRCNIYIMAWEDPILCKTPSIFSQNPRMCLSAFVLLWLWGWMPAADSWWLEWHLCSYVRYGWFSGAFLYLHRPSMSKINYVKNLNFVWQSWPIVLEVEMSSLFDYDVLYDWLTAIISIGQDQGVEALTCHISTFASNWLLPSLILMSKICVYNDKSRLKLKS